MGYIAMHNTWSCLKKLTSVASKIEARELREDKIVVPDENVLKKLDTEWEGIQLLLFTTEEGQSITY